MWEKQSPDELAESLQLQRSAKHAGRGQRHPHPRGHQTSGGSGEPALHHQGAPAALERSQWGQGSRKKRLSASVSVQLLSRVRLSVTPWTAAHQASLSITNSWSSPKPMSIVSVMPANHLVLCRPLLLQPSIFPSIRVFPNDSALHIKWPKYWSFSFSISPSSEHPGLIFRMGWLDLLAVQRTLKSRLQHHSSKASILQHLVFIPKD